LWVNGDWGKVNLKFKKEVCLLSLALSLFVASAFLYSYQTGNMNLSVNLTFPYQGYGLLMVALGSAFTAAAFISYSRHGKNVYAEPLDFSSEDKPN